uniref:hypothetical protein n=1 Tax=Cupriavidus taiwanensis TaxID=164546 RepID=UPI0018DC14D4|nr:hypothetical protein [Cupriavidus taiwanensis]
MPDAAQIAASPFVHWARDMPAGDAVPTTARAAAFNAKPLPAACLSFIIFPAACK